MFGPSQEDVNHILNRQEVGNKLARDQVSLLAAILEELREQRGIKHGDDIGR